MDLRSSLRETPQLDLSCLVSRQSHSCVFRVPSWPGYNGPVAVKAIAPVTPTSSVTAQTWSKTTPCVDDELTEAVCVHPLVYEAALHRHIGQALCTPRYGIPLYVDCVLADTRTTAQLNTLLGAPSEGSSSESHVRRITGTAAPSVSIYPLCVTQFVKAASLDRLFYTFPILPLPVVISTIGQVAHLLAALHREAGVVYGDLKLKNALVAEDRGRVWLVDLASSCLISSTGGQQESVQHVVMSTTPHVLSPELHFQQALAIREIERSGLCTSASQLSSSSSPQQRDGHASARHLPFQDLWALGVFCMELLSGRMFEGDDLVRAIVAYRVASTTTATTVNEGVAITQEDGPQGRNTHEETFRCWVREQLNGPIKARYASALSAERPSSAQAHAHLPDVESDQSLCTTTLWDALVAWVTQLLEPNPSRRFASSRAAGAMPADTSSDVVCWDELLNSDLFRHVSDKAPLLMAFVREAGSPIRPHDDETEADPQQPWWWPEACEEEVGDLMIGL